MIQCAEIRQVAHLSVYVQLKYLGVAQIGNFIIMGKLYIENKKKIYRATLRKTKIHLNNCRLMIPKITTGFYIWAGRVMMSYFLIPRNKTGPEKTDDRVLAHVPSWSKVVPV